MDKQNFSSPPPVIPSGILWPFILLTSLFACWGLANNMTDTLLAAFKRIMSMSDSKTAYIQVTCYFFGYGCFAIPGAMFIKKYTYKSGVLLGLGMFAVGGILFYPAMFVNDYSSNACFAMYLVAILILFAGLSILETACNPYICAMGPEATQTRRLNFSQSFNPLGSIGGVVLAQVFILSQLKTVSADERAAMDAVELHAMQRTELYAITSTYAVVGLLLLVLWLMIFLTRMPSRSEEDKRVDFFGTLFRLSKNYHYVWGVVAQFFYVGAQIAVWSYIIRYSMSALNLEAVAKESVDGLRHVEPVGAVFYDLMETIGFTPLIPKTPEQAGGTIYILSLILFVFSRFLCTALMKFVKPHVLLTALAVLAVLCGIVTIYGHGIVGVYALIGISGCMSLMFPTIFGLGVYGLGNDTKMGGAGMVMAIAGAALLTQCMGYLSDFFAHQFDSAELGIRYAYWVPTLAFVVIAYYAAVVCRNDDRINDI